MTDIEKIKKIIKDLERIEKQLKKEIAPFAGRLIDTPYGLMTAEQLEKGKKEIIH